MAYLSHKGKKIIHEKNSDLSHHHRFLQIYAKYIILLFLFSFIYIIYL